MSVIIALLVVCLLVLAIGSFVYTGFGFHNRRSPESTWHDMTIDVLLLGLVVVFMASGIGTFFLKGSPDRHGDDWGLMFGILPAVVCMPLALTSPIVALFGWRGMDRIHKVRAFIPIIMYMFLALGSGLTNR